MIFQVSIGSKGDHKNRRYSVRVPVTLPTSQALEVNQGVCFLCDDFRGEISPQRYFYSITVGDFSSEAEAASWLNKLSVALLWVTIKLRLGLQFKSAPTLITLRDEPAPIDPQSMIAQVTDVVGWKTIDGFYADDDTVIKPEDKKLIRTGMGRPILVGGIGFQNFLECLLEGFQHPSPGHVLEDSRLRLAIEIYASSYFESSRSARLLTLVTVLEALSKPKPRCKPLVDCVQSFKAAAMARSQELKELCEESDYYSFLTSLGKLAESSIAQQIRFLLITTLADTPEGDHISKFSAIYAVRSRLLHDGHKDDKEIVAAISTLEILVPAVLRRLLLKATGP